MIIRAYQLLREMNYQVTQLDRALRELDQVGKYKGFTPPYLSKNVVEIQSTIQKLQKAQAKVKKAMLEEAKEYGYWGSQETRFGVGSYEKNLRNNIRTLEEILRQKGFTYLETRDRLEGMTWQAMDQSLVSLRILYHQFFNLCDQ